MLRCHHPRLSPSVDHPRPSSQDAEGTDCSLWSRSSKVHKSRQQRGTWQPETFPVHRWADVAREQINESDFIAGASERWCLSDCRRHLGGIVQANRSRSISLTDTFAGCVGRLLSERPVDLGHQSSPIAISATGYRRRFELRMSDTRPANNRVSPLRREALEGSAVLAQYDQRRLYRWRIVRRSV